MGSDIENFLGGGPPALPFPEPGTSYTVTITDDPVVKQALDYDTGEPATWPDGNPKKQMIITGTIPEDEWPEDYDEDSEGACRLFIQSGLVAALKQGLKKARAKIPEVDGVIEVEYVEDGKRENKKKNPPKIYEITYTKPSASARARKDAEGFLGTEDEDDEEEAPPPKRRSRAAAKPKDEDPAPARRRRAAKPAPVEEDDEDEDEEEAPPPRRRRRTSVTEETATAKRNVRSRAKAKAAEEDDDDEPPF